MRASTALHPATLLPAVYVVLIATSPAAAFDDTFDYDYYDVIYGVGQYIVREMLLIDERVDTCLRGLPRRFEGDPAPGNCRFDAIERLYNGAFQHDLIQPLSECVKAISNPALPPETVNNTVHCLGELLNQPVEVYRG